MNEMQVFSNEVFGNVRAIKFEDNAWFVGKDVVEVLGYNLKTNSYVKYIKLHCDEDDCIFVDKNSIPRRIEFDYKELGQRGGYLLNEYAVIGLTLGSPLPQAKQFKRWVIHEVIPSILETGSYSVQPASYQVEDPIERAKAWIKEQEAAKKQVAEAIDGTDKIISLTEIAKAWGEKYPKLRVGLTTKAINQWLCYHDFIKHKTRNTFTLLDKGKELLLPGGYVLSKSHDKDSYNWGTKMINFFDDNPELLKSFEKYIGIHYEIQLAKWDREDEAAEMELLDYEEDVKAAYDDIVRGRYSVLR